MIRVSSQFDGGNIRCLTSDDPSDIQLAIEKDHSSEFYQWFYFRVSGARELPCTLKILNAKGSAFTDGWTDYQACASYDLKTWFRVATAYDGEQLIIRHTPAQDACYFAYFAPYTVERHRALVAKAQAHPAVRLTCLGPTLDGQDLDLLQIGTPDLGRAKVWLIARQHPGETMAEWWMEGMLDRLLDGADPVARAILQRAVVYVVPNMNPDGSRRGHLRTNASGANLNREWVTPSLERSPEVAYVRKMMEETGVDFFLDVHGDEAIPHNFLSGSEGIPSMDDRMRRLEELYGQALLQASPDFQRKVTYPPAPPGKANLTIASNYVGETFGCLSMTLEMPFKDVLEGPDPVHGWSPARCQRFGAANLDALLAVVGQLR